MSRAKNSNGLTQKQENFCNCYIEEQGNASAAYRRVYSTTNQADTTITENASRLMSNSNVIARIEALQAKLEAKSNLTKERVLKELETILEANIADYVELVTEERLYPQSVEEIALGSPERYYEVQILRYKDFSQLTEQQLRAIESVKQTRNGIELKLHGKSWTIERISKMLGYDAPVKVEEKKVDQFSQMSDKELKDFVDGKNK